MLDQKEIEIEIAKWEYLESSYDNYAKLANLYTIRDHMKKQEISEPVYERSYSAASASTDEIPVIGQYGDSEFLQSVAEKDQASVWSIMDDLMDTLHTVNPRVYNGVMRKIREL